MATNIGPKIGVDGEREFNQSLKNIIQQSKTLESQMKLVASQFTATTTAEEKNVKTASVLTKQIDVQRQKVALLAQQTGKAAAQYGVGSTQALKYQEQLNKAQTVLNKMQQELKETTDGVEELGDEMEDGGTKALSFGDVLKANLASEAIVAGAKAMAAAVKAVADAVVDVGKQSIAAYAEYEQLVGGVDTLFGENSAQVQEYANNAFKTAGLSANEYMETVTSFSASLLQSLGGDTAAAAAKADQAITDMSDNANKMGTDMTSIQNAYQGFAKANYTMLDNLKLGYGGTKEEMQRLLTDAEKLSGVKYDISSYADIVDAIHVVQTEMGITGTTAREAATTIQGSASAMKSAWQNLLTGFSAENMDLGGLVQNMLDAVNTFADNLIPRLQVMVPRLVEGLIQLVNGLMPYIPPALELLLPTLVQGIGSLTSGIVAALPAAVEAVSAVIPMLVEQLVLLLPQIITAGVEIIAALASGIGENLPALVPAAVDAIVEVATSLVSNVDKIIEAAGDLLAGLASGLIAAIPHLVLRIPEIIAAIVKALLKAIPQILNIGVQIVEGLWNGIKSAATWLYSKLKGWVDDILGWIMGFLGIHSPSKLFADEIGKFIPPGITLGVEAAMPKAMRDMGEMVGDLATVPLPGSNTSTTNVGGVQIVVYGAQGQDVNELADIVMARMQGAVERREAVFA